jgi:hypothetical protein
MLYKEILTIYIQIKYMDEIMRGTQCPLILSAFTHHLNLSKNIIKNAPVPNLMKNHSAVFELLHASI